MTFFMTSQRLGFRHWAAQDYPLAAALWCDPEVMRHMGGPYNQDRVYQRLSLEIGFQEKFGFQYWPIFSLDTGEHVGCAGLRPFHDQIDPLAHAWVKRRPEP